MPAQQEAALLAASHVAIHENEMIVCLVWRTKKFDWQLAM